MDVTSEDSFLLVLLWSGKGVVAKRRYGIKGNYLRQSPHSCECDLNEKKIITVQIYVLFKSCYSKRGSQGHRFNLNCN